MENVSHSGFEMTGEYVVQDGNEIIIPIDGQQHGSGPVYVQALNGGHASSSSAEEVLNILTQMQRTNFSERFRTTGGGGVDQNAHYSDDWGQPAAGGERPPHSTFDQVKNLEAEVHRLQGLLYAQKEDTKVILNVVGGVLQVQQMHTSSLRKIEALLLGLTSRTMTMADTDYSVQRGETMLSSARIPTPMSMQDSQISDNDSREFENNVADQSSSHGGGSLQNPVADRSSSHGGGSLENTHAFTAGHDEQSNDTVASNSNTLTASSIPSDRRQSGSSTISTNESGYCDDRGDQIGGAGIARNDKGASQLAHGADATASVSNTAIVDSDLAIVGEVFKKKNNVVRRDEDKRRSRNVSGSGPSPPTRKPSIFATKKVVRKSTVNFDLGIEDNVPSTTAPRRHEADEEVNDINNIFNLNDEPSQSTRDSSTPPKRRRRQSGSTGGRIKGIAKAPLKRELNLSIDSSRESDTFTVSSSDNTNEAISPTVHSDTIPLISPASIKKEKFFHAFDVQVSENCFKCICGHGTTTRQGLNLHVKTHGCEEPRFRCMVSSCSKRFLFPHRVRDHVIKDHGDNTCPDKVWACHRCGLVTGERAEVLNDHLNEKDLLCESRRKKPKRLNEPRYSSDSSVCTTGTNTSQRPSIICTL